MTALPGRWAVIVNTPVGRIEAEMTFVADGTAISGRAVGKSETVSLTDIHSTVEGETEHVTWRQSITKPMRLNLDFDVAVTADEMHGHSRAGRLPRSTVTGRRMADSA